MSVKTQYRSFKQGPMHPQQYYLDSEVKHDQKDEENLEIEVSSKSLYKVSNTISN